MDEVKIRKSIAAGILAHVDAGKTTLAESLLYLSGSIRKAGRVDHQDAFLDTDDLERARGITIFSKQARLTAGNTLITLMDTPGHVDFSAEMERTLQVLDYAVLVISGADGVQGHVETLWRLLQRYDIPVFLFVNKMDQEGASREGLMEALTKQLDEKCIDFSGDRNSEEFLETLAVCDEKVLESYLERGEITEKEITRMIKERSVFPCYFGSALKMEGVDPLLNGLDSFTQNAIYSHAFGARVFKISRDGQGIRLTHLKVTGGSLKVKQILSGDGAGSGEKMKETGKAGRWEEKVNQIRIYSGEQYQLVQEAKAGTICAVTGLGRTYAGEGLGQEPSLGGPVLEPVLTYQIQLPPECEVHDMLRKLRELEEEDPLLQIEWNETLGEIHAKVMGEVQIEVLKSLIRTRFGVEAEFGSGSIVYKETIAKPVEGIGHFEPLRHYAEVHLWMEPGEPGSGICLESSLSEDELDANWQKLVLTHLAEKKHPGILTGSELTDVKITLAAGRAHLKHTEGGDFRQATYRAVRQGLRKAESVLLEPVYEFRLEIPAEQVGRAMNDIQKYHGKFQPPLIEGTRAVIEGSAPVSEMQGYQTEVHAYTGGRGSFFCRLKGYEKCHNTKEVMEKTGYEPEQDTENPTGSVFCSHGAGFLVDWDQVETYMHLESVGARRHETEEKAVIAASVFKKSVNYGQEDKELKEIFERTYGPVKREQSRMKPARHIEGNSGEARKQPVREQEEYLLVDGYNIIFAWEDLKELAGVNLEAARNKLMDILCDYQGYKRCTLILVFDAYRVKGGRGSVLNYNNIHVVFTKEAETADQYIEKTVHDIGRKHWVTVATSDGLEQVIILGQGAKRMSALGLKEEIETARRELREQYRNRQSKNPNYLLEHAPEELAEKFEDVRLGKKEFDGGSS